ncbi:class I SAM-dependent methyltransferase [Streptomyces sp. DSM 44915]|uniref:Class I SAM-dependent methyltransferase n=1 Tax=Streptomyces chisholmiae TaxID=3075540 RepID=A0ABU2JN14_9ACTN|nr:class I SAM-dependent methyltransferase [Streptomyces sp. DSM 44915]MDT0266375.1 class I SAM-dependent methyltransferase [Streptomyces sp. DSM 44915]
MTEPRPGATPDGQDHVARNRAHWDGERAAIHGPLARAHWASTEPTWGLWGTPDSRAGLIPADIAGQDVVELGCGTAYVSAWLARAGARPVGIDISAEQLATARALQREFGLEFPLLLADAERVPLRDGRFALVISDYGASLWCDPYRWVPEAARLLAPGGRLAFSWRSPIFTACRAESGPADARLRRPYFSVRRHPEGAGVEFNLPHGAMLRLLRGHGFTVDDLIEVAAPESAVRDYPEVSADWARAWPSEELWVATRTG